MSLRLEAIYRHAYENWSSVGGEWINLFTDTSAVRIVEEQLRYTEGNFTGFNVEKAESSTQGKELAELGKLVILALDSASGVLTLDFGGPDYTNVFRRALIDANERIRKYHPSGGIFAVLADRDPKLAGFTSPRSNAWEKCVFPPFVLTHNMDAFWKRHCDKLGMDEISAYKFAVTQSDPVQAFESLILMGRPLWASIFMSDAYSTDRAIILAAHKLLVGLVPGPQENYKESTMFGVSSLLCRLGLRFRFTAAQAPRAVAHLMATLAYLHPKRDGQLVVHSSEPVLALGATRLWYSRTTALSELILPEFKRLLAQGELDVVSSNELAACILLLLAVDTCEVVESRAEKHSECIFTGAFVSVGLFMKALGGVDAPPMGSTQSPTTDKELKTSFEQWRSHWSAWKLGFTHFIHLSREPTEDTLWYLLGRRAAGVFPRDHDQIDLVIPMFCVSEVSMILVQIEGTRERHSESFEDDLVQMHSSSVFTEGNPLKTKSPVETIRIVMSFGKEQTAHSSDPDRFYVFEECGPRDLASNAPESSGAATYPFDGSFVLCVCFVGHAWHIQVGGVTYPVVSKGVEIGLADLTSARWDPTGLVAIDLCRRRAKELKYAGCAFVAQLSKVMPDEELSLSASQALITQRTRPDGFASPSCPGSSSSDDANDEYISYPDSSSSDNGDDE